LAGPIENLVINIGKILNIINLETAPLEIAAEGIPDYIGPGVTQMAVVVDGDATAIDADLGR